MAKASPGIRFNEHTEGDGPTIFAHACKMGLEGIVSKRKGSAYRFGRSPDWLKMKNANAPAVKREAEEEWSKRGRGSRCAIGCAEFEMTQEMIDQAIAVNDTFVARLKEIRDAAEPLQ